MSAVLMRKSFSGKNKSFLEELEREIIIMKLSHGKFFNISKKAKKTKPKNTSLSIQFLTQKTMTEIQTCEHCGNRISKRKVRFDRTLASCAAKMYYWGMRNSGSRVFISQLGLNTTEYANISRLVRFGLAYKNEKMKHGEYGINMHILSKFLSGEWTVAEYFIVDPLDKTKNELSENRINIYDVPNVSEIAEMTDGRFCEYEYNEAAERV
jgi:hypothetical protein